MFAYWSCTVLVHNRTYCTVLVHNRTYCGKYRIFQLIIDLCNSLISVENLGSNVFQSNFTETNSDKIFFQTVSFCFRLSVSITLNYHLLVLTYFSTKEGSLVIQKSKMERKNYCQIVSRNNTYPQLRSANQKRFVSNKQFSHLYLVQLH